MSITRYHFNSFNLGCHFAQGNEFQSMQPTIVEMVKASDYDALAARVAELEAKLGQAQHAYTVTAMELDRYKNPGQTIRLSAADGGCQSKETK